jgi:excisionase family DNA binding protein
MSLEHSPTRQRRRRARRSIPRVALTVTEWTEATGLSVATTYRLMAAGKLRFTQFGRTRRIPVEEQVRLGLISAS